MGSIFYVIFTCINWFRARVVSILHKSVRHIYRESAFRTWIFMKRSTVNS